MPILTQFSSMYCMPSTVWSQSLCTVLPLSAPCHSPSSSASSNHWMNFWSCNQQKEQHFNTDATRTKTKHSYPLTFSNYSGVVTSNGLFFQNQLSAVVCDWASPPGSPPGSCVAVCSRLWWLPGRTSAGWCPPPGSPAGTCSSGPEVDKPQNTTLC